MQMEQSFQVNEDTHVFHTYHPVGPNWLPVNAYLVRGSEPALIDAGMPISREEIFQQIFSLVEPEELKWVVITHDDNDHAGNLQELLKIAPNARVITNFLSVARMSDTFDVPLNRLYAVNSGDSVKVGDRTFTAVRPPTYDSPTTLSVMDSKTGTLFGSDSFGSLIPAPASRAEDVDEEAYLGGMGVFATALSPWTALVDQAKFEATLAQFQKLAPKQVLSAHGPAYTGDVMKVLRNMQQVPSLDPYVTPDQRAVEEILEQISHAPVEEAVAA